MMAMTRIKIAQHPATIFLDLEWDLKNMFSEIGYRSIVEEVLRLNSFHVLL
jgi:hypothetical protein